MLLYDAGIVHSICDLIADCGSVDTGNNNRLELTHSDPLCNINSLICQVQVMESVSRLCESNQS